MLKSYVNICKNIQYSVICNKCVCNTVIKYACIWSTVYNHLTYFSQLTMWVSEVCDAITTSQSKSIHSISDPKQENADFEQWSPLVFLRAVIFNCIAIRCHASGPRCDLLINTWSGKQTWSAMWRWTSGPRFDLVINTCSCDRSRVFGFCMKIRVC